MHTVLLIVNPISGKKVAKKILPTVVSEFEKNQLQIKIIESEYKGHIEKISMSEFLFNFIGFTLLGAVAIVLIMGIYTLFKGGSTSKKYSNKLMQLRVLLQFIAIIVLVLLAYFFKD